ncbi:13165_t:CDS:2 [Ambispora gerdemannii]|uniref:13165_t:CDS:1 n=1 Tax=Ambispora gerdemannii TaxID=144530 RepID=A0A9N9F389_9GLOM|nr:13165_t:CDS:2 [Ambispora gerdemannii]
MSNFAEWASEKLSSFHELELDRETLEAQIIPYLLSFDDKSDLAKHLQELLGVSGDRTTFIEEFIAKRFPPQKQITATFPQTRVLQTHQFPTPVTQSRNAPSSSTRVNRQENSRSSSPQPNKDDSQEAWKKDKNVYIKKKDEEDYFVGSKKSKQSKNLPQVNNENPTTTDSSVSKPPLPPPNPDQQQQHLSAWKSTKSTKKLMDLEKAIKDLENDQRNETKRVPCHCQATKHPLLEVAPNCLSCGKIICTFEGIGPCTFCGNPVISREQQLEIARDVKKNATSQQQKSTKKKKVGGGGSIPYAAKVSGNFAAATANGGGWVELGYNEEDEKIQNQIREERRRAAEMHKEKLLEYDRTSAKRSTIIDQAADFTLPADRPNQWLNEQEQTELQKKQKSNLRKIQKKSYGKRKVYSLKELEYTPEFINLKSKSSKNKKGSTAQEHDEKAEKSNTKKTTRVQDIDEYFKDATIFSGRTDENLVDDAEPECG